MRGICSQDFGRVIKGVRESLSGLFGLSDWLERPDFQERIEQIHSPLLETMSQV